MGRGCSLPMWVSRHASPFHSSSCLDAQLLGFLSGWVLCPHSYPEGRQLSALFHLGITLPDLGRFICGTSNKIKLTCPLVPKNKNGPNQRLRILVSKANTSVLVPHIVVWNQEFHEPLKSVGDLPSFNYGCEVEEYSRNKSSKSMHASGTNFGGRRRSVLKTA